MSVLAVPRPRRGTRLRRLVPALGGAVWLAAQPAAAQSNRFVQRNLVSDIPGLAANTDPQLSNPWGISFGPATPFWISDANTGVTTLYNGAGVKQALVVTIPGPATGVPGVPTGQVFNGGTGFTLANGNPARFIFASATGTISGWNGGTVAERRVIQFPGSSFTGLAIGATGGNPFLYAANFATGQINVFDTGFSPTTLAGAFTDPTLPSGYAPFNVQNIGGLLYVAYAIVDRETGRSAFGAGNGIVNVFDLNGNLVRRLATGGALNAPWGFALAPSSFGAFGGDLLVGNLGDGTINAFDPVTGAFQGTLRDQSGAPIVNDGLWGIAFGNNGPGFDPNTLYLAAGIQGETHGLFASISAVPEPSTVLLTATGLGALLVTARRRRRQ